MPLLRSVEDTRSRLGFDEDVDRDEAIESHLGLAVETISDKIRTEITRVAVVDTFFIRQTLVDRSALYGAGRYANARGIGIYATAGATTVQLNLSRGFVDTSAEITIYASGTEDGLDDESLRADLQDVSGTGLNHALIQYECGFIRINDMLLNGTYVRVSYKAGFLNDSGTPAVFEDTPDWLVRAADLETRILVNADAVFGRDKVSKDQQDRLESRLSSILLKHARYFPMSEAPTHTVEIASAD
jgi:hypothetical protein